MKIGKRQHEQLSPSDRKQKRISFIAYCFTLISFIIPIVFLIVRIIFGEFDQIGIGYHSRADYALMIAECVLGIIVIHIPTILEKKFKFEVPFFLYISYIIFLYCSIFLGEVQSFYYNVPHWDTILHAMSSLMLGFFGFMVVTLLNKNNHVLMKLSPFFVSLFAFCFAVTIGALWEIYEFSLDGIMGFNMQKYLEVSDGVSTPLVGHEALVDTMKDIIIDAIGAVAASVIGYIGLKQNKKWLIPKRTLVKECAQAQVDGANVEVFEKDNECSCENTPTAKTGEANSGIK